MEVETQPVFDLELFFKMINNCNITKDYSAISDYLMDLSNKQLLDIINKYDFETYFVTAFKNAGLNKFVGAMLYSVMEKKIITYIKDIGFYKFILNTRELLKKLQQVKI